ncbi:MAG: hypothetical protein IPN42_00900 [Methylococcaceae bacterium]|nr:hypothetical protein [Methylococcaceae bacterium]
MLNDLRNKNDQTPFYIYAGSNATKDKLEAMKQGAQGLTNSPQELFELITQLIL